MKFTKMQGCGNDYVYINMFEEKVDNPNKLAVEMSDRHFGVGSDGLVLICPADNADFTMRMFNSDGSESEMCGNAIRCVGKYVYDRKLTDKNIDDLLSGKKTSAIKGFKKKDGGTFTARLKLENGKITPEFVREK